MATRADDNNEAPFDTSASTKPGFDRPTSAAGDLTPITTPDSDGHSAPDPEFVPERQAAAPTDIAHTRTAALWTGLSMIVILAGIPWWRPLLRFFTQ